MEIDCTGLACPEPVLRTKAALDELDEGILTLLVDSAASRENVQRFAESQGCAVTVAEEQSGVWRLEIAKGFTCEVAPQGEDVVSPGAAPVAFLVTNDSVGPEPDLGKILMRSLLSTLTQTDRKPARILFLNRGVFLTTEGSEALDVLADLEGAGVGIFTCGTCLEYFSRKDALRVGHVSNMYDTVETLTGAYRTVTVA